MRPIIPRIPLILVAAFFASVTADAQATAAGVQVLTGARMSAVADSLARAHALAAPLGDRGSYAYFLIHRDAPGEVEVHRDWADVLIFQAGTATVETGGDLSGGRQTGPGETRGGELRGAERRQVAAGDVVVIPAGVPHRVAPQPGGQVTYLAIKVARAPSVPPAG